eukprot:Em0601g2a
MGCSSIVDPRSAPTTTYVPAATDSIYTTTPNVVLRPGDPLTVSVNVESLPNAPLDLYILMDLSDSMAAPLATVKSISQLIAQQVSSITTNVRIGFGAFNDKPIYPTHLRHQLAVFLVGMLRTALIGEQELVSTVFCI